MSNEYLSRPLLPKPSSSTLNVPTTAISYENVNSEIQSIRLSSPDQKSIFTAAPTNNEEDDQESTIDLNIPNVTLPNTSKSITFLNLFTNPEQLFPGEFINKYLDLDKSNNSNLFHCKLKQFFVFSSAGKPIYSMNGSDDLVLGYMGILTTIISSFQEKNNNQDQLKSITMGDTKIIVLNKSPIYLITISKLSNETESMLSGQLSTLYDYLLAILSKPAIDRHFQNRLNYDLRRVLNPLDFENLDKLCMDLTYGYNFETYINQLLSARQRCDVGAVFYEIDASGPESATTVASAVAGGTTPSEDLDTPPERRAKAVLEVNHDMKLPKSI
ncbi:unnamed protein product [Candida verbasci]|uniref:Vacuolar fusion protein MON1 n=1 Tax=Candida verbasci TaxID=1227364 RepID=A0A9W4TUL1_9ASCO|nr:unnamed protein product [Candida verbasci]